MDTIDLATFNARADALLSVWFTKMEPAYRATWGKKPIVLNVKTYRTAGGATPEDCEGTAWPASSADEAAKALAKEFGLKSSGFDPVEKGWGSYYFEAA